MELEGQGAESQVDSPSTTTPQGDGTTQPAATQPEGQQPRGFHEHPDWQRMVASRREDRVTIQRLEGMVRQLQQTTAARAASPDAPLSQEEQTAIATMKRLMARDPDLAAALGVSKQLPEVQDRLKGYEAAQAQAARAHMHAATTAIKELATEAELPTDPKSLLYITRLVATEAMGLEGGDQRFQRGDLDILREAFENIKPFLAGLRKPAETNLANTKDKVKRLPLPARGGAAGPAAPPKLDPNASTDDVRKFEANLGDRARKMLESLRG